MFPETAGLRRPAMIALLAVLVLLCVMRGVIPALSKIDSDFPNYITSAKIVADGGDVARLYDNAWFQEQVRRYRTGNASTGKFSPFPPPTALLLVPLAAIAPLDGLRVLTGASLVCLVCSIVVLARTLAWSYLACAVFVLLSGGAILNALRFGQPYIFVALSCVLGYYARVKGRPWLAGVCFGLFAPIKYFPIVFLGYFALRREWKVALGGALAILTVLSISVAVLGWQLHMTFLSSVLGNHLVGKLSMQDPFTASFQSFDTLFRRLFVFDSAANPQPLLAAAGIQRIGEPIVKGAIAAATLTTLVKLSRDAGAASVAPSIGILGLTTLLLAPATATYHFVLLWLPVGLLIDYFLREHRAVYAHILLGCYTVIGFFPYRYTAPFEGRGGLTLIAYPRLFLLSAMLITCLYFVWGPQARPARQPTAAAA